MKSFFSSPFSSQSSFESIHSPNLFLSYFFSYKWMRHQGELKNCILFIKWLQLQYFCLLPLHLHGKFCCSLTSLLNIPSLHCCSWLQRVAMERSSWRRKGGGGWRGSKKVKKDEPPDASLNGLNVIDDANRSCRDLVSGLYRVLKSGH